MHNFTDKYFKNKYMNKNIYIYNNRHSEERLSSYSNINFYETFYIIK